MAGIPIFVRFAFRELQVEEDDLDEAFRPFGELTSLHLPLDRTEAC